MTQEVLAGIRITNDDPLLGLQSVVDEAGNAYATAELDSFLTFLRGLISELGFDYPQGAESLPNVRGSELQWQRRAYTMYPLYIEKLIISGAPDQGTFLKQTRTGEWLLPAQVLDASSPHHFAAREEEWHYELKTLLLSNGSSVAGGFTFNSLRISAEELYAGTLDIRPPCAPRNRTRWLTVRPRTSAEPEGDRECVLADVLGNRGTASRAWIGLSSRVSTSGSQQQF